MSKYNDLFLHIGYNLKWSVKGLLGKPISSFQHTYS